MRHPPLLPMLAGLALLGGTATAHASESASAFQARPLPQPLRASVEQALPHTPKPFPGDDDLEFEREGPSPWVIVAALLGTGAAVSGLVALASHARSRSDDTPASKVDSLESTRDAAAWVGLGLAGSAGVCLVIQVVK